MTVTAKSGQRSSQRPHFVQASGSRMMHLPVMGEIPRVLVGQKATQMPQPLHQLLKSLTGSGTGCLSLGAISGASPSADGERAAGRGPASSLAATALMFCSSLGISHPRIGDGGGLVATLSIIITHLSSVGFRNCGCILCCSVIAGLSLWNAKAWLRPSRAGRTAASRRTPDRDSTRLAVRVSNGVSYRNGWQRGLLFSPVWRIVG